MPWVKRVLTRMWMLTLAGWLVAGCLGALSGCEPAYRELEKRGLPISVAGFVRQAERNDLEAVRLYLATGITVDAVDRRGTTALMAAAANGLTEILKLLLEHDADAAITDDQGNTARDQALQKGQHNMADLLPV